MLRYLSESRQSFDPETIDILVRALDEAWERFQASRPRLDGHSEAARAALAKHIVDMAKAGERDPQRLIESALLRIKL
jgi:hypothetical protein